MAQGTTARGILGAPRAVLLAVALAVAAVVALAGCASAAQHTPAGAAQHAAARHAGRAALTAQNSAATARHVYDPYSKSGRLEVAVAHRASGSCWTTSLADPTASAFRCLAGNQILDPCFARPGTAKGGTMACVADPWSKATVLTLTKALPGTSFTAHRVFAFVRSDGARCVAATGTVPSVAGRNLDYNCSGGTYAALNDVRSRHVQAVFARLNAKTLRRAGVRDLWHS